MATDSAPEIEIGESRRAFTEWALDLFREDAELEEVYSTFQNTSELVEFLMETCLEEKVCGEPELTALAYATYFEITPAKLRERENR